MQVELILVIEVDIGCPELAEAFASATPIAPNLPFYRAADVTPDAARVLAKAHLQHYFDSAGAEPIEVSLYGGYVLRINGQNVLFPQCCGELSDIVYWKYLAKYHRPAYYNGHPAPEVTFTNEDVIFDCRNDSEAFQPRTPPVIRVLQSALSLAYEQALLELEVFARQLERIQQELPLLIENIAYVLIYHNPELPDSPQPRTPTD